MSQQAQVAAWFGAVTLEPGRLVFSGAVGAAGLHAHAAVQVMRVTAGDVSLQDRYGQRRSVQEAWIPSRALHSVHGLGAIAVFMYCDPDSAPGRVLRDRMVGGDRDHVDQWITAAQSAAPGGPEAPGPHRARHAMRMTLNSGTGPPSHPAVRRAIDRTQRLLGGPVRLQDLAEFVDLSPSRLGHLFAEELGLPFPVYLRWARLRRAMELVREGASLTQAAHGAGFVDSSHLTRVFHEMFGLAPSTVLRSVRWDRA
ncbi:helix-turn-helix transcriptional regulator [Streptomyces werraensis]|uniref:helix-turn-helix transcriptional regulator n=1 Tax=Streptomyces werraensis TaxID=68284 RepID=UPI0033A234B8